MSEGTPKSAPVATPWPRHWRTPEFIQTQTYYNRKIYNEEVTDKLQFLEDKKPNVNLIMESPENNLT